MARVATVFALCFWFSSPAVTLTDAVIYKNSAGATVKQHVQGQQAASIINGSLVANSSSKYSFFAMPTDGENSQLWLGCGASIISPTWGVTASHCFGGGQTPCKGPHKLSVYVGDLHLSPTFKITPRAGGRHAKIAAEIVCHPQFDGKCSHGHDITLLHLLEPLPSWVTPVRLNLDSTGNDDVGQWTMNMGFGITEEAGNNEVISETIASQMHETNLTIFGDDFAACASVYAGGFGCSDSFSEAVATNQHQQLCAGANDGPERDTCSGDSGSPMLNEHGVQIGIVSYGGGPGDKMSGPGRICADPAYMGVYSRVSAFKEFIQSHVTDLPTA